MRDAPVSRRLASRRAVLRAGAAALPALAGCAGFGGDATKPAAVSLADGQTCDHCGMVIERHPGPNGQLFYAKNAPEGHANPARFDSLERCFFPYYLDHERRGWTLTASYVTDYSAVDYRLYADGGVTFISSHTDPASFGDAEAMHYVVRSGVQGAMGPDFVPFSERADAEGFASDHGGEVVGFEDVGAPLLSD